MNCRRAGKLLSHGHAEEPALTRHVATCPDCERLARRWTAVRTALQGRRSAAAPDAGFAARVAARLDRPASPWAWAARRMLPATLALTLVLGGWCLLRTPAPSNLAAQLADGDLLTWMAGSGGETP